MDHHGGWICVRHAVPYSSRPTRDGEILILRRRLKLSGILVVLLLSIGILVPDAGVLGWNDLGTTLGLTDVRSIWLAWSDVRIARSVDIAIARTVDIAIAISIRIVWLVPRSGRIVLVGRSRGGLIRTLQLGNYDVRHYNIIDVQMNTTIPETAAASPRRP